MRTAGAKQREVSSAAALVVAWRRGSFLATVAVAMAVTGVRALAGVA